MYQGNSRILTGLPYSANINKVEMVPNGTYI
jgi:hypothetical protein